MEINIAALKACLSQPAISPMALGFMGLPENSES
jgi:hypothetical protein